MERVECPWRSGSVRWDRDRAGPVLDRVEHRQDVARLDDAIHQAVCVDRRVADVGCGAVRASVELGAPVPHRHDDVAFYTGRPGRYLGGEFAVGDPITPIGEHLTLRAEPLEHPAHRLAHRPGTGSVVPGFEARRCAADDTGGDLPRRLVADLMAIETAGHGAAELLLRELALWEFDHGQPPRSGIDLGGGPSVGRHDPLEIKHLAGHGVDARRVHQSVAAHEHLVGRCRKIGQHIPSLVIGGDDPSKTRR